VDSFKNLYERGLPDGIIAEILGVSRPTIVRLRQELNLPANREVGQRGPGKARDEKSYYLEVKRVLRNPEVGRALHEAAREAANEWRGTADESKAWIATGLDPAPVPHFNPGPYAGDPAKMDLTTAKLIAHTEQRAEYAVVAGVPGPAIFELARVIKTADKSLVRKLALEAVRTAFMVGVHQTVAAVRQFLEEVGERGREAYEGWKAMWRELKEKLFAWAPVREERRRSFRFFVPAAR
jgi:hypothetical protein